MTIKETSLTHKSVKIAMDSSVNLRRTIMILQTYTRTYIATAKSVTRDHMHTIVSALPHNVDADVEKRHEESKTCVNEDEDLRYTFLLVLAKLTLENVSN